MKCRALAAQTAETVLAAPDWHVLKGFGGLGDGGQLWILLQESLGSGTSGLISLCRSQEGKAGIDVSEGRKMCVSSGLANGGWGDAEEKQSCGRKIAHLFPWVQSSIFGHMHFSAQIPASARFSLSLFPAVTSERVPRVTMSSEQQKCSQPSSDVHSTLCSAEYRQNAFSGWRYSVTVKNLPHRFTGKSSWGCSGI